MPQTTTWIGQASSVAVAEVDMFTPGGTITTGDVNHLTITKQDGTTLAINFSTGSTTTATAVSAGLIAAWNGNLTAAAIATASGTSTVILTAVTAGTPINTASTVTGVGTLTKTTTTANVSPNDWATANNWSTGVVPGNGDTVYITGISESDILFGLNQTATGLTIHRTIDSTISVGQQNYGLNPGSGSTVFEGEIPQGVSLGLGSARVKYACGTNAVTFYIYGSGTQIPLDSGRTVLQISGGATGTKIYIVGSGGTPNAPLANIGMVGGDIGTIDAIDISAIGSVVNIGPGITLAGFQVSAGTFVLGCGATTFSVTGNNNTTNGTVQGVGLIGTASIGGKVIFNNRNGSTIITTLTVLPEGFADFSQNLAPGTVGTLNQYASTSQSSSVRTNSANPGHITFTTKTYVDGGTITLSN